MRGFLQTLLFAQACLATALNFTWKIPVCKFASQELLMLPFNPITHRASFVSVIRVSTTRVASISAVSSSFLYEGVATYAWRDDSLGEHCYDGAFLRPANQVLC
jgi:hypothetical protein